jgi:drug/metabolite transporter (DMT)-like permease
VLPIVLLGVAQLAALVVLLNFALQFVTAARATLLFSTMPLMTVALAALLGRERLRGRAATGLALTVVGVALALCEKLTAALAGPDYAIWLAMCRLCLSALAVLLSPATRLGRLDSELFRER